MIFAGSLLRSVRCSFRFTRSQGLIRQGAMASSSRVVELDRASFDTPHLVTALRIPKRKCADAMRLLKGCVLLLDRTPTCSFTFNITRFKCLVDDPADTDKKLLLLDNSIEAGTLAGLPEDVVQRLQEEAFGVTSHEITVGYNYLSTDQVLKKILPEGVECPTSFETVGHIAHFNLREEHMPYKHVIGQVFLDKNPGIKTVVTKVGEIENEFRVFAMEVIAGENNLVTEVNQHGHRFKLDYSTVFWNSRLEHEHRRLVVEYFKPGDVIADIMAGIGPFVIPAAKAGCTVYSNDLNPQSTKWLKVNIKLNKVERHVHPFCMDGRAFVRLLCATPGGPVDDFEALASQRGADENPAPIPDGWKLTPGGVLWQHGVMNLPRTAVEFCDAFRGAFDPAVWKGRLPLVHCYTFQKDETTEEVIKRIEEWLGGPLDEVPKVHKVRDVAPNKLHVCVSFRIPEAVAFHGRDDVPDAKRQKV